MPQEATPRGPRRLQEVTPRCTRKVREDTPLQEPSTPRGPWMPRHGDRQPRCRSFDTAQQNTFSQKVFRCSLSPPSSWKGMESGRARRGGGGGARRRGGRGRGRKGCSEGKGRRRRRSRRRRRRKKRKRGRMTKMLQNSFQHPRPAPLLARSGSLYVSLLSITRQLSWAGLLNGLAGLREA